MRVPNDVLQRVRGAMVVVTLAACGGEPVVAPPSIAPETTVAILAPIDPVPYEATRESMRLTRLDVEDEGLSVQRQARVSNVEHAMEAAERARFRAFRGSVACGRG